MRKLMIITIAFIGFTGYIKAQYKIVETNPNERLKFQEIEISTNEKQRKVDKSIAVMIISREIEKHLGPVTAHDYNYSFTSLKKYDIIIESRSFPEFGWVDVYEIVEKGMKSVGYVNTRNPYWIEVGGTTTINLPPYSITNEVLKELENYLYVPDIIIEKSNR